MNPFKSQKDIRKAAANKEMLAALSNFTKPEVDYLITKLRNSTYSGTEFEQFYTVMVKLQELYKNLDK